MHRSKFNPSLIQIYSVCKVMTHKTCIADARVFFSNVYIVGTVSEAATGGIL